MYSNNKVLLIQMAIKYKNEHCGDLEIQQFDNIHLMIYGL